MRKTIRNLNKKNEKQDTSDTMALTNRTRDRSDRMTLMPPGDSGVVRRRSTVKRNKLNARRSMRPSVMEFEDTPVLGDLKAILFG